MFNLAIDRSFVAVTVVCQAGRGMSLPAATRRIAPNGPTKENWAASQVLN